MVPASQSQPRGEMGCGEDECGGWRRRGKQQSNKGLQQTGSLRTKQYTVTPKKCICCYNLPTQILT